MSDFLKTVKPGDAVRVVCRIGSGDPLKGSVTSITKTRIRVTTAETHELNFSRKTGMLPNRLVSIRAWTSDDDYAYACRYLWFCSRKLSDRYHSGYSSDVKSVRDLTNAIKEFLDKNK